LLCTPIRTGNGVLLALIRVQSKVLEPTAGWETRKTATGLVRALAVTDASPVGRAGALCSLLTVMTGRAVWT
jgi:hypothetical protein